MKRLFVAILVVSLLVSLPLTGCRGLVKGSGEPTTEDFDFTNFSRIEASGSLEVDITRADSYAVSVTTDDNMLEHIKVSQRDDKLKIGLSRARYVDTTTKVVITMPQLRSLRFSGGANGTASDFDSRVGVDFNITEASSLVLKNMAVGDTRFDVSDTSKVNGNLTAGDVEFKIDGASTIHLDGAANNIVCKVEDSSQLQLDSFTVDNADVLLSGDSTCTVNLNGKLDVDLRGESKLTYSGEPTLGSTKISDGSTMNRK